ncbi:hypothetical protein F443_01277 [Phytophthora nicotianae P1569]|uniref:Uncharacterized protein n=1 Tax=Phytophthora nicotianae P1569 TaxID=1317065 RepID=V9FZA6_PHYNI|nr:hypothetical protein F443_01277 [Phytophthora nicotianae P1569]
MVDDLGVAVTLPSPVRAPVAPSPCDTAAEAPGSSLVPFRPVTSPVGSSATASATPYFASTSSPPSVLQELIYEITVEGLCGDDEDTQCSKRTRLRRGDETSDWHPFPLPKAPERHPTTNHRNHYNPYAPWDYANSAGITRLLDVERESPRRCYLAQWKCRPLQMSWVWMELLDKESTRNMIAFEAGTCFMDAFRCALYHLGRPNLVTMEMWDEYEKTRPETIVFGVSLEAVTEISKPLQRQSVPLNYGTMLPNILHGSIGRVVTLERFFEAFVPGTYLASAGQDDVGHCFVVVKTGPNARLVVLDGYSADHDPLMEVAPLSSYQWIESVKWISRVQLQLGYVCRHGKRTSKTARNRKRRLMQQ